MIPSGTPLPRLIDHLNRDRQSAPTAPVVLPAYATPASLPSPTTYLPAATAAPQPGAPSGTAALVFVTSLGVLAVADGAHWRRTDTGAVIA